MPRPVSIAPGPKELVEYFLYEPIARWCEIALTGGAFPIAGGTRASPLRYIAHITSENREDAGLNPDVLAYSVLSGPWAQVQSPEVVAYDAKPCLGNWPALISAAATYKRFANRAFTAYAQLTEQSVAADNELNLRAEAMKCCPEDLLTHAARVGVGIVCVMVNSAQYDAKIRELGTPPSRKARASVCVEESWREFFQSDAIRIIEIVASMPSYVDPLPQLTQMINAWFRATERPDLLALACSQQVTDRIPASLESALVPNSLRDSAVTMLAEALSRRYGPMPPERQCVVDAWSEQLGAGGLAAEEGAVFLARAWNVFVYEYVATHTKDTVVKAIAQTWQKRWKWPTHIGSGAANADAAILVAFEQVVKNNHLSDIVWFKKAARRFRYDHDLNEEELKAWKNEWMGVAREPAVKEYCWKSLGTIPREVGGMETDSPEA